MNNFNKTIFIRSSSKLIEQDIVFTTTKAYYLEFSEKKNYKISSS